MMPVLEILFFGILAVSVLTSVYMVGLFIHRVRVQRAGLDETLCESYMGDESMNWNTHSNDVLVERQNVVSVRIRRKHQCSTSPDLLVVPGNGYAAVLLPMDVGQNQRDLVRCRVYLN